MKKFGWAYIGCGTIAHTTAKELVKSQDNEIVAVWNRTYEKAEKFAKKYGGKAYQSIEEAIHAPGVEGVYIALTADQHAKYVKLCIEHQKPVLCEKPFAVNAAQAEELFRLAKEKKVYVSEAMWTWHNKTAQRVKAWISEGKVGAVQKVDCAYAFPMLKFSRNPRIMNPSQIGGALMDIGIYGVRYCYELFGMPNSIFCEGRLDHGADLGELIRLDYNDFSAKLNIALDKKVGEYFTVSGSKGTIHVPMFHMASKASLKGAGTDEIRDPSLHYAKEFSNVAAEIREGLTESRIISSQSTVDCLKIMDECRRQMKLVFPFEMSQTDRQSQIRTISHLGFNCRDIEKSIAFYRNVMGCTEKFTLTYGDVADDIRKQCNRDGKKYPLYLLGMKRMKNTKWSVYMQWADRSFIELFYIPNARRRHIPDSGKDLNYTHYALEVSDIYAFRDQVLAKGGAPYVDTEIATGIENTLQFWMHDPDGNRFEIMEYTPSSYQVTGR